MYIRISDHSLIYACRKLALTKSRPNTIETRNLKSFNPTLFNADLTETLTINDWESQNPNVNWIKLKKNIKSIAELHVPT